MNHDHGKNQDPNGQVTQINSILEFQISSNSRFQVIPDIQKNPITTLGINIRD